MEPIKIILPIELATSGLSLQEIGTIFVMFSFPHTNQKDKARWGKSSEFAEICNDLIDKGLITINKNDSDDVAVDIDLTKLVHPDDVVFWDEWDYDEDDNVILSHPSNYGDEGSRYEYLLYRSLKSNKIVYSLHHSEYGLIEDYLDSIEDAELLTRERLAEELEQIKKEDLNKSNVY